MHSFLFGLGVGCGWSVIVRCCNLSVSCVNSTVCESGWASGSKWVSWSRSCWNWSCNSVKWWCVRFLTVIVRWFIFLSGHDVVWWYRVQGSRDILSVMIATSCCHGVGFVACSKGVYQSLQGWLSVIIGHVHVAVVMQVIRGESHLPGNGCVEHIWVGHPSCIMRGFTKCCWWDPVGYQVSAWSFYWQVSLTALLWGLSLWHQCKGTKCYDVPYVKVQDAWPSLDRGYGCCCWPRFTL